MSYCLQAGLPDGTHITRIQDGVALLQCAQDWQASLSLNPIQVPESADTSAAQLPELEQGQPSLDSQGKPENTEAQVPSARTLWVLAVHAVSCPNSLWQMHVADAPAACKFLAIAAVQHGACQGCTGTTFC